MADQDCIFCKIIAREVPAQIIQETEDIVVIKDIAPKAPVHYLIIPKKHIRDLRVLEPCDYNVVSNLLLMAQRLAKDLPQPGAFNLVSNNGREAGQQVHHIHFHFLAGKQFPSL
ncbi:HIT domain-containing protein [Candidatus Babeliales bacterium]|nr:HIT domain-containing protein [Candidatus Babeliales bacterium]